MADPLVGALCTAMGKCSEDFNGRDCYQPDPDRLAPMVRTSLRAAVYVATQQSMANTITRYDAAEAAFIRSLEEQGRG